MSQQSSLQSDQDALSKKPPTLETVQTYVHISTQWEEQNRILKSIEALQKAKEINTTLKGPKQDKIAIHIEYKLASHCRTLGKYKIALTHYKNHLLLQEQKNKHKPHIQTALAHFYLASLYESLWRLNPAITHYDQAVSIAKNVLLPNDPNLLDLEKQAKQAKAMKPSVIS